MKNYAKIRDDNLKEQIRRFNSVFNEYADIREEIERKKRLQNSFDIILSDNQAFKKYTGDIRSINANIKKLLEKHGLPANYLEPIYDCPICEDKGFYYDEQNVARRCACNTQAGFGCTFDDFNIELFSDEVSGEYKLSPRKNMENILKITKEFCENYPNVEKPNFMFYGSSGLGKSFLASCMCSALKGKGFSAVKVNAFKLTEEFRAKFLKDVPFSQDYYGCDFLVIDDLGTESMYANITVEYLFDLINERIEKRRSTLFVTNQSFEQCCARYNERVASRMFDGINTFRFMFIGENLRLKK